MRSTIKRKILLFATCIPLIVNAFNGSGVIGGRAAGMGKASVSLTDFWAIQNNPAGIAGLQQATVGLAYENRYMMKELALKSAAIAIPTQFGVLGASFNQFGYHQYNENKLGLAYARAFGPSLRIGLQLDYLSSRFAEGYEGKDNVTFELGVQTQVNRKLAVGAYIFNPVRARLSNYTDERIPVVMRFGVSYLFTPKLLGVAEIEKNSEFDPDIRMGLEFQVTETFYTRAGLAVNPGLLTFGSGLHFAGMRFDLAASLHQRLGASVQAGIVYSFGKIKGL